MKKIIVLIFLVTFIKCNKYKLTDVCYPKEGNKIQCHGKYGYYCGDFVCINSEYSCYMLSLFSQLRGQENKKKYELFINRIRTCPDQASSNKYKWRPTDVCLKNKVCFSVWSIGISKSAVECQCSGKYSYKCKDDYCGLNKLGCDGIKKNMTGIKKCINH